MLRRRVRPLPRRRQHAEGGRAFTAQRQVVRDRTDSCFVVHARSGHLFCMEGRGRRSHSHHDVRHASEYRSARRLLRVTASVYASEYRSVRRLLRRTEASLFCVQEAVPILTLTIARCEEEKGNTCCPSCSLPYKFLHNIKKCSNTFFCVTILCF